MKTTSFNLNPVGKYLSMLALLCCLLCNRAQAQYIPIDSGFAGILIGNGMGSCVNNFQLDTTCAKAQVPDTYFRTSFTSNNLPVRSLEGMQYVGKNLEGQPTIGRSFISDTMRRITYIPDLPAIYHRVQITDADSLSAAPYPGNAAVELMLTGSGIVTLPTLPNTLEILQVNVTNVTTLPTLPPLLRSLDCGYNKITAIPSIPASLTSLVCNDNQLTALPILSSTILEHLQLNNNHVSNIPTLPASLKNLGCDSNGISILPTLPPALEILVCSNNPIAALPTLPSTLQYLICSSNNLTAIPPVPNTLRGLTCSFNNLTELPVLENTVLEYLECNRNQIRTLPRLPNTALPPGGDIHIVATYNQIDSVTNFPDLLTEIDLTSNNLVFLPPFNDTIRSLFLANNNLLSLPPLPTSLRYLFVGSNPIRCLPMLPPNLQSLSITSSGITCLPNLPLAIPFFTAPICSDTDYCYYMGIGGRVYIDKNDNCVYDAGDIPIKGHQLKINNLGYTLTDSSGRYKFLVEAGTYSVEALNVIAPFAFSCTAGNVTVPYNGTDTIDNLDFPLHALENCAQLHVDISTPIIRIAMPNTHTVLVKNLGTETSTNVVLKIKFEPELTPLSSTPAWNQQIGNTLVFNIDSVRPFEEIVISIIDSTSINAVFGQTACVMASITGDGLCGIDTSANWDRSNLEVRSEWQTGEDTVQFFIKNVGSTMASPSEYRIYEEELLMLKGNVQITMLDSFRIGVPANGKTHRVEADQRPFFPTLSKPRSFVELAGGPPQSLGMIIPIPQDDDDEWIEIDCHAIVNAYDPNDKQASPSGVGANHYITANDELEYQIRFQNTGNDTAFNIRVIDTLDATRLDIETFRSGVSSHPYTVSMQGNGIITWRFANILLPDSHVNEPLSHGFVKFKINQKAGNAPGAVINNFVDIYFDYNTPVRTNTAFVTIEEKEKIFNAIVEPRNIANGYTVNVMPNPFAEQATFSIASKYSGSNNYTFELFDITGRTVQSKQVEGSFNINRDGLTAGMYLFKITENGKPVGNGKLIVK